LLRAYRATQPRLAYAVPVRQDEMLTVRRISAAFKDIPGGQFLGPTLDYSHRLLRLDVLEGEKSEVRSQESEEHRAQSAEQKSTEHRAQSIEHRAQSAEQSSAEPDGLEEKSGSVLSVLRSQLPSVTDWHRANGLAAPLPESEAVDPGDHPDVTREPVAFPAPRAQRLQSLARADTGGVLALGYASMRGYGLIHPIVNELRLGYADLRLRHPISGEYFSAGRVRLSQTEVANTDAGAGHLTLGFTATLGWNEVKTIAGAMLDLEMDAATPHPAHSEDFVLYHTEPVEASGFCIHFKLPHYVTFNSGLDALREGQKPEVRSQKGKDDRVTR
jgi:alpha-D-ribose 1-methylphosphonate 5-triphosphate synthase subunit PhnI